MKNEKRHDALGRALRVMAEMKKSWSNISEQLVEAYVKAGKSHRLGGEIEL